MGEEQHKTLPIWLRRVFLILGIMLVLGVSGVAVYRSYEYSRLTALEKKELEVQRNGYSISKWVSEFLDGNYTVADLYTEDKLSYTQDIYDTYNISYSQYTSMLNAIVDAVDSITVERGEDCQYTLTIVVTPYKICEKPIYDKTGITNATSKLQSGEYDSVAYTDEITRLLNESFDYTVRGNNATLESVQFTYTVTAPGTEPIVGISELLYQLMSITNVRGNVCVYETYVKDEFLSNIPETISAN